MKVGFLLIALMYLSAASDDIVIECEYKNDTVVTLNNYDNTLVCCAKVTNALTSSQASPVKMIPIDEIQRLKVEHFRLVDQDLSNHFNKIMEAIATNFPKLRGIRLGNASISHISKDHLRFLFELELVNIDNNKITVLESDLFTYTPNVKFIYFDCNEISYVDDALLSSLDFVEVDFSSNPCIARSTCKSHLLYEKLKYKNPTLYHYYELSKAIADVLKENPNYGR